MKQIYKNGGILYGCVAIEAIFTESNRIAKKRGIPEGCIFLVGQYADKTESSLLRYYWHLLRYLYQSGNLETFREKYNILCNNVIFKKFGRFAWFNTLSF